MTLVVYNNLNEPSVLPVGDLTSIRECINYLGSIIKNISPSSNNYEINEALDRVDVIAPGFKKTFKKALYDYVKPNTNDDDWASNNLYRYKNDFDKIFKQSIYNYFIADVLSPGEQSRLPSFDLENFPSKEYSDVLQEIVSTLSPELNREVQEKINSLSDRSPCALVYALGLTRGRTNEFTRGYTLLQNEAELNAVLGNMIDRLDSYIYEFTKRKDPNLDTCGDHEWGKHHRMDDRNVFEKAVAIVFSEQIDQLSEREKQYLDLRVYQLTHAERIGDNWGTLHRMSNLGRLALAMRDTVVRRSSVAPAKTGLHHELYQAMDVFHNCAQNFGVKYCAIGGTLLGVVRHKAIIPHDDDLDVVVHKECLSVLKSPAFLQEIGCKGYEMVENEVCWKIQKRDGEPTKENNSNVTYRFPWVDIFVIAPDPENPSRLYLVNDQARSKWPKEHLTNEEWENVENLPFGNIQISALRGNRAKRYLDTGYGPTWDIQMYAMFDHVNYQVVERVPYFVENDYRDEMDS